MKKKKLFTKILMIIGLLALIPLIVAFFVDNEYTVVRIITINKPSIEVFEYVKLLKNQENYSKWANIDPSMKKTYQGTDGTVGFISRWESNNPDVGVGEQEIIKIYDGERIDYQLRFEEPFKSTSPVYISIEPIEENVTIVQWGFAGKMNYPMNLMMLFVDFEKMIGDDFQIGLDKLKKILEKKEE